MIWKEGFFEINDLEKYVFDFGFSNNNNEEDDYEVGYNEVNCIRVVIELMFVVYFGEDIIDVLFDRYVYYVVKYVSCINKMSVIFVVLLIKKLWYFVWFINFCGYVVFVFIIYNIVFFFLVYVF